VVMIDWFFFNLVVLAFLKFRGCSFNATKVH
jgi:hypothetical protein